MAGTLQTFGAFVKNSYGIQVATRCSSDVEELCQKNFLSFCELLRPFSQLTTESQLHDPQGHLYPIRDLRIRFSESNRETLPPTKIEQLLSDTVHWSEKGILDGKLTVGPLVQIGNVETPATTPWFDHYCETYIDNVTVMEHEYVRHYVAVILVVSSRQSHPIKVFQSLYRTQKEAEKQGTYPYWLPSPHIFYYHVLVHDVLEGNRKYAQECFELLKGTYGAGSCYFLPLNSLDPQSPTDSRIPEPWSGFLRTPSSPFDVLESTDFGFNLHSRFRRKKQQQSSSNMLQNSPQVSSQKKNHTTTVLTTLTNTPTNPEDMREEARLIMEGEEEEKKEEDEDESEYPEHSSSTVSVISSQIELGDDPLSGIESISGGDSVSGEGDRGGESVKIGQCMSLEDQNNLRSFVRDFSGRILPHLEAVLKKINESLQSRRTVSRRMSSFSRGMVWKMFGMGSGGTGTSTSSGGSGSGTGTSTNNGDSQHNLGPDSIERQMRLVGDLAFLLQNYELAYSMHHTLKRDLQGRDLWIHYAGAHEIAALSAQMMGSSRKEIQSYLEEATSIYTIQLKLPALALRASIFLCEILKSRSKYRDLTQFLVKLISDESHLRSALFLEQAAHSFLRIEPVGMFRKYALHLILSAHHYSRSGQRAHAVRVYNQALEIYCNKGWSIAEDFAHYSCGRLCFSLQRPQEAHKALESLLSHESEQTTQQQLINLRDYIHVRRMLTDPALQQQVLLNSPHSSLTSKESLRNVPFLPLPFIKSQQTITVFDNGVPNPENWLHSGSKNTHLCFDKLENSKLSFPQPSNQSLNTRDNLTKALNEGLIIGVSPYTPDRWKLGEKGWQHLEALCWSEDKEDQGIEYKPAVLYMNCDIDNSRTPLCPLNEPVRVGVVLKNPLGIALMLRHISLVWQFSPQSNQDSNECGIVCEVVDNFILPPKAEEKIFLWVMPVKIGTVEISGLIYNLCVMEGDVPLEDNSNGEIYESGDPLTTIGIQGRIDFQCRGVRLNNTKVDKVGVVYAEDHRLCWRIIDPMPRIMIYLTGLRAPIIAGEVIPLALRVINCSPVSLSKLKLSSSLHHCTLLKDSKTSSFSSSQDISTIYTLLDSLVSPDSNPISTTLPTYLTLPLPSGSIPPGRSEEYYILLHTPQSSTSELPWNIVVYYEPHLQSNNEKEEWLMSHRVLRHSESLSVQQCLHVKAVTTHSLTCKNQQNDTICVDLNKLLITVEVDNTSGSLGVPVQLQIVQVSSVSCSWKINNIIETIKDISILPGGSGVIHLHATRSSNYNTENLQFSDVTLSEKTICSSKFPAKDFFASDSNRIFTQQKTGMEGGEILENKIGLILFWRASYLGNHNSWSTCGHHYVNIALPQDTPILAKPSSLVAPVVPSISSPSSYDLVKHTLQYAPTISHDFCTEKVCIVPVVVLLENCTSKDVMVTLELLLSSEVAVGTRSLELPLLWSGPTKRSYVIPPLSKQSEQVFASFTAPGIYNLNALRMKACYYNNKSNNYMYYQRWQTSSYIVVSSTTI